MAAQSATDPVRSGLVPSPGVTLIYSVFFLSGFSGLIYESIWTHYLKLFLGHAAYAQTLVMAIFMGGMGLGSWLAARFSPRVGNLFLCYALIEGVIGLQGLLFHPLFVSTTRFAFDSLLPGIDNAAGITAVKWLLGMLLILPQSVLLGATFPVISAGVIRVRQGDAGKVLATLYFLNSFGASLGVLASGFYLVNTVGLPGTILTAGIINILLAVLVYLFHKTPAPAAVELAAGHITPASDSRWVSRTATATSPASSAPWLLLAVALLTGFSSFIYEISWIRMLSILMGASTHAFELMLSAFILGLAIGGWLIRKHIDHLAEPVRALGYIQILMGVAAALTLVFYNSLFEVMAWVFKALQANVQGYVLFTLVSHALALVVMLPATIFAGMTLPLITHGVLHLTRSEKSIGYVYAANTLGSIAGILVTVHMLMPWFGLKNQLLLAALLDIGIGFLLFRHYTVAASGLRKPYACSAAAVGLVGVITALCSINLSYVASGVFRHGNLVQHHILFHRDGKTSTVDVVKDNQSLGIITNGKPDAAINIGAGSAVAPDEYTMALLALIPLSVLPDPHTIAVVGMGSGITTHTLLGHDGLTSVDTIEIEPAMVEGARYFAERSARTFTDPRSHIRIEDAKTFFTHSGKQYDLIISEPSNPWVSGVSGLFTRQYYDHVSRYLAKGGVFGQWIHTYEINDPLVASVIMALSASFTDYAIYRVNDSDLIILAANGTVPDANNNIFSQPAVLADGQRIGVTTLDDIRLRKIGGKTLFDPAFRGWTDVVNSDYFPVLDQNAVAARFKKEFSDTVSMWSEIRFFLGDAAGVPSPTPFPTDDANRFVMQVTFARQVRELLATYPYADAFSIEDYNNPLFQERNLQSFVRGVHFCRMDDPDWLKSATWLTLRVSFYLPADEAAAIWQQVEARGCADTSTESPLWASLFAALAKRDFPSIVHLAGQLLQGKGVANPDTRRFLGFVLLASQAKLGDYEGATRTYGQYYRGVDLTPNERTLANLVYHGLNESRAGRAYRF